MKLRKLEQKDAPYMLEWMHDKSVVEGLQKSFMSKTIEDCMAFIDAAQDISHNLHLAIVDDCDIYMGTVSLKNIKNGSAEFAITVRKSAMGIGYSDYGMSEIIRLGFEKMGLERIYWYVKPENGRALRFYDKRYRRVHNRFLLAEMKNADVPDKVGNFIWYLIEKENAEIS